MSKAGQPAFSFTDQLKTTISQRKSVEIHKKTLKNCTFSSKTLAQFKNF